MSKLAKALSSAAGNAGGDKLYVEDVFSTYLYTGNSSTQTITNGIDLDGEGGLVWMKARTNTTSHSLIDTARGGTKQLKSDTTSAEATYSGNITAFNTNGFSLGDSSQINANATNYCSWSFRKAPGFFDVVTYTGNGVAGREIAHSLNGTVGSVMIKVTNTTSNWFVWHRSLNQNGLVLLNSTNAVSADGVITASSDTTVTLENWLNSNGKEYVMYLFAHDVQEFGADGDESVIKCGEVATNSSSLATLSLGWEPQWILLKNPNVTNGGWTIVDSMRGAVVNGANSKGLFPNTLAVESPLWLEPTADGCFINGGYFSGSNANSSFIYIAIRRPMKVPESGTEVFMPTVTSGAAGTQITTGFVSDLQITTYRLSPDVNRFVDRLRGFANTDANTGQLLQSQNSNAETSSGDVQNTLWNTGFKLGSAYGGLSMSYYSFRRAAGFMDMVCYTGTNGTINRNHNLGVAPELMITKRRNAVSAWTVLSELDGSSYSEMALNSTIDKSTRNYSANQYLTAQPTASVFAQAAGYDNVSGGTYISYLFATLAGVSKVGSYTGAGAYSLNLDMGFTGGARFFLCKRTDASGDWYTYDSARGIVAGNDPYWLLNSAAADVTNTDYVDPLAAGITLTAAGSSTINVSGGSYIFLAIA